MNVIFEENALEGPKELRRDRAHAVHRGARGTDEDVRNLEQDVGER